MLTNVMNLPAPLVRAAETGFPYEKGDADYSVTGLLTPPRVAALRRKHRNEIPPEDVSDVIWRLEGQALAEILFRGKENAIQEERFALEIGGVTISGKPDFFDPETGELDDWKKTSVYAVRDWERKPKLDWVWQVNIYAEILRAHGHEVKTANIIAFLRDWQRHQARYTQGYPKAPVVVAPVELMPDWMVRDEICRRIEAHEAARKEIPECSREDRWEKPEAWAVIKRGGKRAVSGGVKESKEDAEKMAAGLPDHMVEHRPGEWGRCEEFCQVSSFCAQYQKHKSEMEDAA